MDRSASSRLDEHFELDTEREIGRESAVGYHLAAGSGTPALLTQLALKPMTIPVTKKSASVPETSAVDANR